MLDIDLFPILGRFSPTAAQSYERWRRKAMAGYLEAVRPEELERTGERLTLKAFRRAAGRAPFYKKLLDEAGVRPEAIKMVADFNRLPVLDKKVFVENEIMELARDGHLDDAKTVLTSSGFSGIFSFGINLKRNLENTARLIDFALDYVLDISHRRTLAINCLPMGVKVHTNAMVLAEVSVRDDMALAVVRKFGGCFDQIIIVGEAFFLKHLVEEGLRQNIDWLTSRVSLVAGEDSFPENYRTYMSGLLGIDPDGWPMTRLVGSSLGIAELDLNLFHETPDTIRLRRLAHRDSEFRRRLFGDVAACPMLFQYYPHRTYLEVNAESEIIITMLSPYLKIPLIRYNSRDVGRVISYHHLEEILDSFGRPELRPRLKLPLVAVHGRYSAEPGRLTPEAVRETLFFQGEIARQLTGYFKMRQEGGVTKVDLQLKKGAHWADDYGRRLAEKCKEFGGQEVIFKAVPYYDFREAITLDYNKKFHHA